MWTLTQKRGIPGDSVPKTQESVRSPNRVLEVDCAIVGVTSMVKTLNDAIAAEIQHKYSNQQLRRDLGERQGYGGPHWVKEYGSSPAATRPYGPPTPKMQTDVLDEDGNLRAADIGITWANETFLHGVRNENPSANRT